MLTKSDLYDILYDEAGRLLKEANPCNIRSENGEMVCNSNLTSCCAGCEHLGPQGCTVKALGCKLWLCREVGSNPINAVVVIALDSLRRVGDKSGLHASPYGDGFRKSKEQSLAIK